MKYITLFDTVADFEAAQATLDKPNVSLIEATQGINFLPVDPYNGHAYVEIGGVKWATKNVGASSIADPGLFFHWGDTQGYTAAQCINGEMTESYKYYQNSDRTDEWWEKYPNYSVGLLSSDDAATAIMGSKWRVPTPAEQLSLESNTNKSFTTNYNNTNVPGYIFTDKTDNTKVLFLPAVAAYPGYYSSSEQPNFPYANDGDYYYTYYWNNNQSDDEPYGYSQYYFYDDPDVRSDGEALWPKNIYYGLPIRAVAD